MKNPTEELTGHILFTLVVGYFAIAQYDVKSPIGALRHFAYAADAPLLSLSRHFPRFIGGIYPEGGSKKSFRKLFPEGGSKKRHYLIKNAPTAILQSARKFLFKIT